MPAKRKATASKGSVAEFGFETKPWLATDKACTTGHAQRGPLAATKVLIPPRPLFGTMTGTMSTNIDQRMANEIQSRALAILRDTLLLKMLRGQPSPKSKA